MISGHNFPHELENNIFDITFNDTQTTCTVTSTNYSQILCRVGANLYQSSQAVQNFSLTINGVVAATN